MATKKVAVVSGVGPGTGWATVGRLVAQGYRVAMIARSAERLEAFASSLPGAYAYPLDVTELEQIDEVLARIETELGTPEVFIHNAVGGAFGTFQAVETALLERNFRINVTAFLHIAQRLAPAMVEAGRGAIIATGNTSAWRGKANFAAFAPTKAAQRILAESMARDLAPRGVHVAYLTIDAVIDVPWARKAYPDQDDAFFIRPDDIAAEIIHLLQQPRGAWTFSAELRPYRENW